MSIDLIKKMIELKNCYHDLIKNHNPGKSKKTLETSREQLRQKLMPIRQEFRELENKIDWSLIDCRELCLLCPGSGPWYLDEARDFKNEGSYFSFSVPGGSYRYVGEYSLLENKCGVDNLKIILKQLSDEIPNNREDFLRYL